MGKNEILKKYFGYDTFREGQEILIDAILEGRDVLGIMPTGAGKSICYQVPALLLPGITVVISPLISLMKDQVKSLNEAGIHAAYINSSLTENQIKKALLLAQEGRYKIIYVAPERLETYEFQIFAHTTKISMVTVDEAHCISQWGQDFRPSYLKIMDFVRGLQQRPIVSAFTATATETVKEDMLCVLDLQNPQILVTGFDRKNLYFGVERTKKKDGYILHYLKEHSTDSGIIYCATRKNVDKIYEMIQNEGLPVTRYHAGLNNEERQNNQEDFIYDRKPIIVATNAFGMGIDKSNVRYVLHYNMPQSLENYYQEAGRAGRDGENSECILLYSPQDVVINRFLMDSREQTSDYTYEEQENIRERDEKRLQSMINYCTTSHCLREYILQYFGEHQALECENCSNCLGEFDEIDVTDTARWVISCVLELRERYGVNVIAGTLAGAKRAKLRDINATKANSYGKLSDMHEEEIKRLIRFMQTEHYITVTEDKYAIVKAGSNIKEALKEDTRVLMKVPKQNEEYDYAKPGKKRKMHTSDILTTKGLELFERLREVRSDLARKESVPPYIIFSDKTLTDMCIKAPTNKEEMLTVSGVGENKYEKYGEEFLNAIDAFDKGRHEKYYFGNGEETNESFNIAALQRTSKQSGTKEYFYLTKEQAEEVVYADQYLVTELAEQMNLLRDEAAVRKLSGAEIFRFVQENGWADEQRIKGRTEKTITNQGLEAGLRFDVRISKKGTEYQDIYYTKAAQETIVKHFIK